MTRGHALEGLPACLVVTDVHSTCIGEYGTSSGVLGPGVCFTIGLTRDTLSSSSSNPNIYPMPFGSSPVPEGECANCEEKFPSDQLGACIVKVRILEH